MKYTDTQIGFSEFPDEISLLINISNCYFHCPECHSPELWDDVGNILDVKTLKHLIESNNGISCVGFMGGNPEKVNAFAKVIKKNYDLKVGWYWGGEVVPYDYINLENFDYIKVGPYIQERGGLNNPNTNQIMYQYSPYFSDFTIGKGWRNITYKFWKHEHGK